MWVFYSLLAAAGDTGKSVWGKLSAVETNEFTAALSMHLVSLILFVPLVLLLGIPEIKSGFWWANLAFLFITPAWTLLYMRSLKRGDLSKVVPLLAVNPVFTAILGYAFKDEAVSLSGWLGILAISLGIYLMQMKVERSRKQLFQPILELAKEPGSWEMLSVALLWSLGAHFSNMRVDSSSPYFATFAGSLVGVISIWGVSLMAKTPLHFREIYRFKRELIPAGVMSSLSTIVAAMALVTGSPAYVFAVKRSGVVGSAVVGWIFFKEKVTKLQVIAIVLVLVGIVLMAV